MRRASIWVVRGALIAALLLELIALHFPAPSGVQTGSRERVRATWSVAGRVARAVERRTPELLLRIIEPIADDKTVHFLLFLPLGLLAALERRLSGRLTRRSGLLLLAGLCLYAALGEASQVLGGRIVDLGDFVANALGGALGVAMIAGFSSGWAQRRDSRNGPSARE